MKKVLLGGLVCTLFLTGCGSKTLTCTMNEENFAASVLGEMELQFSGNGSKLKDANFLMTVEVEEEYSDYMDELEESLMGSFGDIEEFSKNVDKSVDGNVLKFNFDLDEKKLTEDDEDFSYDKAKSSLEKSGFTCK